MTCDAVLTESKMTVGKNIQHQTIGAHPDYQAKVLECLSVHCRA